MADGASSGSSGRISLKACFVEFPSRLDSAELGHLRRVAPLEHGT